MVTVSDAQKYRDSIIGSAGSSGSARWVALHPMIAGFGLVKRTATAS